MTFDFGKFDTANLIATVGVLTVAIGFLFSYRAMRATTASLQLSMRNTELAARNAELASNNAILSTKIAQANLFNNMVTQGRDLQILASEIELGDKKAGNVSGWKDQLNGTLISYYAACFELRLILEMPDAVRKQLDYELKCYLDDPVRRRKYEDLAGYYSDDFNKHAAQVRSIR